jgi:signal peptidase I
MQFKYLSKLWQENKSLVLFAFSMLVFRSAVADYYHIPSGSMEPTIAVGDRISVDKMAYDFRLPFSHVPLLKLSAPKRGDIIVFDSKAADNRLIKRVVGLPGDRVAMKNERLYINGKLQKIIDKHELLGGLAHLIKHDTNRQPQLANFNEVVVPEEHFLVLGDNRRASADSRVYGFVPRHEILGRANKVLFSLDKNNYYLPRAERFFKPFYKD